MRRSPERSHETIASTATPASRRLLRWRQSHFVRRRRLTGGCSPRTIAARRATSNAMSSSADATASTLMAGPWLTGGCQGNGATPPRCQPNSCSSAEGARHLGSARGRPGKPPEGSRDPEGSSSLGQNLETHSDQGRPRRPRPEQGHRGYPSASRSFGTHGWYPNSLRGGR